MNPSHRYGLDRAVAEQLLAGRPAWPSTADPRLLGLLAAAAAPARKAELAGEGAVVDAFRCHHPSPAVFPEPLPLPRSRLAGPLPVRLAAAATLGVAGVGVAAFAGTLPGPGPVYETPGSPHPPETSSVTPRRKPAPSLLDLCTAWLAQPPGERNSTSAFAALATAAGGADRVNAYCTSLAGVPSAPGPESPAVAPAGPGNTGRTAGGSGRD
ncbi:hypothetical protein [Actinoplanes aureus]|uniref:Uncharacterized protein n=1 Tax=Actinoplanes aureus TaxID=2792083 RepID=A0A931G514_9ACTN|nr:hypothetical protein [Actinoplanes aureus]MBG0568471.1 hypothetical protein [Actinoplanes aureus]